MNDHSSKSSEASGRAVVRRERGFSLIELIGVMAVISIMASVMMPSLITTLRRAAAERESAELRILARGLTDHIKRNKHIPDEKAWAQAIATELGRQLDSVAATANRSPRLYVIDPALRIGDADGKLPYTQKAGGSIEPVSPRLMILTSLDRSKTLPFSSGVIDAKEFDAIWNTAEEGVPAGWTGRWKNAGDDLKIQRLSLAPLFRRLILNNFDLSPEGVYAIDDSLSARVSPNGVNAFYVEGTAVKLFDRDGVLESSQVLRQPSTFVYERGTWRGQLFEGLELTDEGVYLANTLFLDSSLNDDALRGVTPAVLTDAITEYMESYANWQSDHPGKGSSGYSGVEAAQWKLDMVSADLIYKPAPYPVDSDDDKDKKEKEEKEKKEKKEKEK